MQTKAKHIRSAQEVLEQQARDHSKPPSVKKTTSAFVADQDNAWITVSAELDKFLGAPLLKFNKQGEYALNDVDTVAVGTRCIAHADEITLGWQRWEGGKPTPEKRVGRIADRFIPPKRDELGDTAIQQWEIGDDGKPRDPWAFQMSVPLTLLDGDGVTYNFTVSSKGGLRCLSTLARAYGARLTTMRYKGSGDSSIHQTQLAVTAALLNRGVPIDEIVGQVLAATRAVAGDEGNHWNWAHEERDIRAMCATWTRKKQSDGKAERPSSVTLVEGLDDMDFKPVNFLVPDLIPAEGVTLICSKPKTGKSWLLYDLCISATADREMLGGRRPMQGCALYLALEDGWRRLKARRDKLLPVWAGSPRPGSLGLAIEWRRVDHGGLDEIRDWVTGVRASGGQVACVCVDVLKMVRATGQDRKSAYDRDYEALTGLRALAHELGIAIVVAHHVRKLEADDLIDKVSGTHGLTGAADTIIVIERAPGGSFVCDVRGRDVEAAQLAARFDRETCRWEILGEAAEVQRTDAHRAIRDAVAEAADPMTPREIAAAAGIREASVSTYLYRMVKAGEIAKVGRGWYAAATPKPASP
jgi:hypothetical protein